MRVIARANTAIQAMLLRIKRMRLGTERALQMAAEVYTEVQHLFASTLALFHMSLEAVVTVPKMIARTVQDAMCIIHGLDDFLQPSFVKRWRVVERDITAVREKLVDLKGGIAAVRLATTTIGNRIRAMCVSESGTKEINCGGPRARVDPPGGGGNRPTPTSVDTAIDKELARSEGGKETENDAMMLEALAKNQYPLQQILDGLGIRAHTENAMEVFDRVMATLEQAEKYIQVLIDVIDTVLRGISVVADALSCVIEIIPAMEKFITNARMQFTMLGRALVSGDMSMIIDQLDAVLVGMRGTVADFSMKGGDVCVNALKQLLPPAMTDDMLKRGGDFVQALVPLGAQGLQYWSIFEQAAAAIQNGDGDAVHAWLPNRPKLTERDAETISTARGTILFGTAPPDCSTFAFGADTTLIEEVLAWPQQVELLIKKIMKACRAVERLAQMGMQAREDAQKNVDEAAAKSRKGKAHLAVGGVNAMVPLPEYAVEAYADVSEHVRLSFIGVTDGVTELTASIERVKVAIDSLDEIAVATPGELSFWCGDRHTIFNVPAPTTVQDAMRYVIIVANTVTKYYDQLLGVDGVEVVWGAAAAAIKSILAGAKVEDQHIATCVQHIVKHIAGGKSDPPRVCNGASPAAPELKLDAVTAALDPIKSVAKLLSSGIDALGLAKVAADADAEAVMGKVRVVVTFVQKDLPKLAEVSRRPCS